MRDELYRLKFDVMRSSFYHQERESWFSFWHRVVMFVSAIAGTSAGATFLGLFDNVELSQKIGVALSATVTVVTTLDLVLDLSGKARLHSRLRAKFYSILAEMEINADADRIPAWRASMARAYAEEPPTYQALDAIAWNQTYAHLNDHVDDRSLIKMTWWQRRFRNICRFSVSQFRRQEEAPAINPSAVR